MARIEKDLLGELELADEVLYGIQTERARTHFHITGHKTVHEIIHAVALVKIACAQANMECGYLDHEIGKAIITACEEIVEGKLEAHFVIDALQGGAGTSTNMNVNEVVANRASQVISSSVHSLEHVNMHQSTNDVYPTAVKIAAIRLLHQLEKSVIGLQEVFQAKEKEFASVIKLGRTQLRDAVPTTLGREFGAYANVLARDRWRIFKCTERLRVVNIGGTAIGTGITAPRSYIFCVIEKLREVTGLGLSRAENLIEATQNNDVFVEVSGILRTHASNLIKFARDIRLMSSGPVGGLGEIELPAIQPGSSIMPGKINPVIPEMVVQAGYRVMAHDYELNLAVMSGELELNAFLPLIADALLNSIRILNNTDQSFARYCIEGIRANKEHCKELLERSHETATAFIPLIGHERAVELAQYMMKSGKRIREALLELKLLNEAEIEHALLPEKILSLGWNDSKQ